jgi:NADPH-dependent curcumin reductase
LKKIKIMLNKQVRLAARPVGMPVPTDFNIVSEEITPLQEGDVLVQVQLISLDPAMRGWMNVGKSYIRPVEIGEVMRAGGGGRVIASQNDKFQVGDMVTGTTGVQDYWHVKGGKGLTKVDTRLAPLSTWLSVLGMTGMTAYFGLLDVCTPKEGDTVLVSGAAGAVGMVVGQIAKIKGCRVIGIAGGQDKVDFLKNELGFDDAIDYKQGNLRSAMRRACPEGIDVYFDNVGGETLDNALSMLKMKARIGICGAISAYNNTEAPAGPKNYLSLLVNRAKMEGFVVFDYAPRYQEAAMEMAGWIKKGQLQSREHVVQGEVPDFLDTFKLLFEGDKIGKLLLKVA